MSHVPLLKLKIGRNVWKVGLFEMPPHMCSVAGVDAAFTNILKVCNLKITQVELSLDCKDLGDSKSSSGELRMHKKAPNPFKID